MPSGPIPPAAAALAMGTGEEHPGPESAHTKSSVALRAFAQSVRPCPC